MPKSSHIITLSNIGYAYGRARVLDGLNATFSAGRIVQVMGENGCGKSTLLHLLAGLKSPDEGEIGWKGALLHAASPAYREQLTYIGHRNAIKPELTPCENLHFLHAMGGGIGARAVTGALDYFGLSHQRHRPCGDLSAGQNRRVALARLVMTSTELWILDEPFTALDHANKERLEALLAAHVKRGGCAVVATHQPLTPALHIDTLELPSC